MESVLVPKQIARVRLDDSGVEASDGVTLLARGFWFTLSSVVEHSL